MKKFFSLFFFALMCIGMCAQTVTYTVAGSSAILGTEWSTTDTNNDMTLVEGSSYTLVKSDVVLIGGTTYEYKVVKNHAWTESWPGQNAKLSVAEDGKYDVTFSFDASSKNVSATAVKKGDAVIEKHYLVVGEEAVVNGAAWNNSNAANLMTSSDNGVTYKLTISNLTLAVKEYEYKIVEQGTWNAYYDNGAGGNAKFAITERAVYTIEYVFTVATSACVVNATKTGDADPAPAADYYLVGSEKGWEAADANKFAATDVEGEYSLTTTLTEGETIKVLGEQGGTQTWYPDGMGTEFTVTAAYAGEKTIYFRPAGNTDWNEFHQGGFFYIEANGSVEPTLTNGYYLLGSMNEWTPAAAYLFAVNEDNSEEYKLEMTLAEGDRFKVAYVENDIAKTWYPEGTDNDYVVDATHTGAKTVYFRPDAQGGEDWYNGVIFVEATGSTAVEDISGEKTATLKVIKNGQLLLERGDKTYNVSGAEVK
ncbi:MAG: hypothetical protein IJS13_00660 [Paludibacteraceae bacterium]|nr:hypothetical protein [Paludibacteraceae bacterium]